jgi:hypothetical protein
MAAFPIHHVKQPRTHVGWAKARALRAPCPPPTLRRAPSCRPRMNAASVVVPLFTSQTARRAHRPAVQLAAPKMVGTVRKSAPLPTLRNSLLASHHHFLSTSLPSFRCPLEGRAERRWRLDACDAPRSACHDRHADASLDPQPRAKPRLAFIAHRGRTRRAIDLRNRANPIASRRPAYPATGTLALRRSTWDFWPGPVRAVVRHALRDRVATSYAARVIVTRRSGSREPPRRGR